MLTDKEVISSSSFPSLTLLASLGLALMSVVFVVFGAVGFFRSHQNTFYPGLYIDGVNLTDLTRSEAHSKLTELDDMAVYEITLAVDDIQVASSSSTLGFHRDVNDQLDKAFAVGRTGSPLVRTATVVKLLFQPRHFQTTYAYNPEAVTAFSQELASKVDLPAEEPAATLRYSNSPTSISINKGKLGRAVIIDHTNQLIMDSVKDRATQVTALVASTGAELNDEQIAAATERAKKFVGKSINFKSPDTTLKLNDQELVELLALPTGLSESKLTALMESWKQRVERPPQDAEFVYDKNTLAVTTFKPHREGLTIDQENTKRQLTEVFSQIEQTLGDTTAVPATNAPFERQLTVKTTLPQKTLGTTNDLGIQERIGFGDSEYDHSIPTRVHNVAHASKKINNFIIKPDEEFSFNKALGDVSQASGYKPAYVIKSGQTVLGDGGGVCQVSTTLFRSVLNAGLPVTKRKAHSYRVSYYELDSKPGVDATVYSGDVDLRFKNDTGHHILIHTTTDSENLYMKIELFGTSDGRSAQIVDHKVWDFRGPPAPVYIPTDTLPSGRTKQIDWAASGIKASFKNVVKDKNGNVIREEEYYSNYVPWSAKYLRGI